MSDYFQDSELTGSEIVRVIGVLIAREFTAVLGEHTSELQEIFDVYIHELTHALRIPNG